MKRSETPGARGGRPGAARPLRTFLRALLLGAAAACGPLRDDGHDAAGPAPEPPAAWRFTEVAAGAGLAWTHEPFQPGGAVNAYDHGNGVAAGDFDGDGHEDILLLSQCGPAGYFLGRGDGTFRDRSDLLVLPDDGVRIGVAYGDYDGDGRTDFYVTRIRSPNLLLRQQADGSFADVAAAAGAGLVGHYSGAAFADFDGDGDLDIVVAGNVRFTEPDVTVPAAGCCPEGWKGRPVWDLFATAGSDPTALLVNGGAASGWTFTEEGEARGIPRGGPDAAQARGFGDVAAFDYDRDGDLDLLLPEMFHGRSALLANDGSGRFTDVTAERIPRPSFGSCNAACDDFNGDGWPDVLMTDMHSDMWASDSLPFSGIDAGVRYAGMMGPHQGVGDNPEGPLYGNTLWLSASGGPFVESDLAWGSETFNPWGALAADFDNDGRPDVFVPSGMSNPYPWYPDVFLHNEGDRFVQRQGDLGFAPPPGGESDPSILVDGEPLVHSTRGAACADFDGDGDLDIVCYAWKSRPLLFRNDLPPGRHRIDVDLRGGGPGEPFGAEVEVEAGGRTRVAWMQGSRGYLSQSTRRVHVGLGEARTVDAVTVRWPGGGVTRIDRPAADRVLRVER